MTASNPRFPFTRPQTRERLDLRDITGLSAPINSEVTPKGWPSRPSVFPELLTPTEAAQYLRLDELGTHTPVTTIRTLNYWRDRKQLKATKYARHVWYRKSELERFLAVKTES